LCTLCVLPTAPPVQARFSRVAGFDLMEPDTYLTPVWGNWGYQGDFDAELLRPNGSADDPANKGRDSRMAPGSTRRTQDRTQFASICRGQIVSGNVQARSAHP